ncbi:thioredoxin [Solitalea koreensis]|uniref:Thioredoxin n=1 Tax=Solitalea koreensis TaxID=543615 RepID=A0A521D538_9SPHI|nr:thioredoxin [Solitalea koreensis]SMO66010.1 thioredoxin [Solitalea koreensis]
MNEKKSFDQLLAGEPLVLVDFSAEWCGPCKMMAPILKEVKASMGDKIKILKVDIDKNQQAAAVYQVRSVPTLLLYKNGKMVWRQSGVVAAAHLKQVINAQIN